MALPDLSNSMYVARLRYIQTVHEPPQRKNPDTWVRRFMPMRVRLRTAWMGQKELSHLRSDPFYYYLLARTKYYDQVLSDAMAEGIERLVMVGCGTDTRSFRFQEALCRDQVRILECDQEASIVEKQNLTRRWPRRHRVEYLPLDLNVGAWPDLESWMGGASPKTLVMIEGVSPYIEEENFRRFLEFLNGRLKPGSSVAYDFKIRGIKDEFGRGGGTRKPFRLTTKEAEIRDYHARLGLQLEKVELSSALSVRLVPDLNGTPLFEEDGLLRLRTGV